MPDECGCRALRLGSSGPVAGDRRRASWKARSDAIEGLQEIENSLAAYEHAMKRISVESSSDAPLCATLLSFGRKKSLSMPCGKISIRGNADRC